MDNTKLDMFRKRIRFLEREIFDQFKEDTACCGVSPAQCHALVEIGETGQTSISDLAERLKLDKSTLSRTIDGLVRQDYVSRDINPRDRRYMCVSLTKAGQKLYKSINRFSNDFYRSVLRTIPEDRQAQIMESLDNLIESMRNVRENTVACGYCRKDGEARNDDH
jgi:DNA-binding MarR family transcriptional regulator